MRTPRHWTAVACAVLSCVALVGCAGDEGAAVDDDEPFATPGDAAAAFLTRTGEAQFGAACQVFVPSLLQALQQAGVDCQTRLADEYSEDERAHFSAVQVDADLVEILGDTATIPLEAFTSPGVPFESDQNPFFTMDAALVDGNWYVLID